MGVSVVVDSNALWGDTALRGAEVGRLLAMSRRGLISLYLPQVVVDELRRHRRDVVDQQVSILAAMPRKAAAALRQLGLSAEQAGVTPPIVPPMALEDLMALYDAEIVRVLEWNGAKVLDLPDVALDEVYRRDIGTRRPFEASGKGLRDTLIWLNVVDLCAAGTGTDDFYLVTDDDIFGGAGLHPDLEQELPARGAHPRLVRDVAALLAEPTMSEPRLALQRELDAFPSPPSSSEAAERGVRSAVADLFDEDWDGAADRWGLPLEVRGLRIVDMSDPRDFTWDVYDEFDGTTVLGQAAITVDILLEGALAPAHVGTDPALFAREHVVDLDPPARQGGDFRVGVEREVVFYFDVRVETIAGTTETVDLEQIETR